MSRVRRPRTLLAIAAATLSAAALAACGGSSAAGPSPVPARVAPARGSHVVVVVMENQELAAVEREPFLSRLARRYALATNYHAITHPSLPNYLALTSGSTHGITSDCTDCHFSAESVADQLERRGIGWRAYMEGLPRPCFTGAGAGAYAKKHDPFAYYDGIVRDPRRCARIVPDTRLRADLASGRLPAFAWISPGLCNDTHDCPVATGDRYLATLVPALLAALGPHGFLVVTWDEGDSDAGCCGRLAAGGRVAALVAGPDVRRGARPALALSHYSTLRTIEDAFGLPRLGAAGSAHTASLDSFFARPLRRLR